MPFDTEAAKKAGYSQEEIDAYLRSKSGGAAGDGEKPGLLGNIWSAVKNYVGSEKQFLQDIPAGLRAVPAEFARRTSGPLQSIAAGARDPAAQAQGMSIALGSGGAMSPMARAGMPLAGPGGTAAPQAMSQGQRILPDFRRMGVTPSMPPVGGGRAAGLAAQVGRDLPASPIGARLTQNLAETNAAAERQSAQYGTAQAPEAAGDLLRNALNRFASVKAGPQADYGQFRAAMRGAPPSPVPNTLNLLRQLHGKYPSAPELEGLFAAPKTMQMRQALEPRTINLPEKFSSVLGPGGQPVQIAPAQTFQRGGSLTVPELMDVHSQIGRQLGTATSFDATSIPRGELKRLYGSLSSDLRDAAQRQGPAALKAFDNANRNYRVRMLQLDRLEPLIRPVGGEGSYARLNRAASDTASADAKLLKTTKDVMTSQEWGDIGASIIRNLGKPTPGARNILGSAPQFSLSTFATKWANISPRAKDLIFGQDLPGSPRSGLESLSRVVQAQKNVGRLSATGSRAADIGMTAFVIEETTRAVMQGQVPWATIAGLSGAYGVSKIMMSPGFTTWLYSLPRATTGAMTPQTAVMRGIAALQQQLQNPTMPSGGSAAPAKQSNAADRIKAQQRVSQIQGDLSKAKRIGDLNETRDLMRKLADADAEYRTLRPSA